MPSSAARRSVMTTQAAAPSLSDDALAAVIVPSAAKAGRSVVILSKSARAGSSSAVTGARPGFASTGTISASQRPLR